MDLFDDPSATDKPETLMRKFRKLLVFFAACAVALFVTVRHRGQDVTVGPHAPISAAQGNPVAYNLAELPIFSRALFHVRESYFDKNRIDPKRMLVGALDFLQRDVPEILVDRFPELEPKRVVVTVNGKQKEFSLDGVDAPWSLRSRLQEIFRFIQPNLQPLANSEKNEEGRRLVEIESAATNGMLYTLDPHSVLLDVDSFSDMRMTTQGKFGGLGIVIGMDRKGRIIVRKPMPGTPAIRAGLRARDHIVRINHESTVNMNLNEAVERLRGDVGSPVDVYVVREADKAPTVASEKAPGKTPPAKATGKPEASRPAAPAVVAAAGKPAGPPPKEMKFTIVRDFIRPPSIDPPATVLSAPARGGAPGGKVGYVKITQFSANTDSDLTEALKLFEKEKVKGIVMDLRHNPGGLYDQAQKVADAFIESGVLVSMVGVGGTQRRDEHASRGGDVNLPLAVLVNQYSASASEIVAGAVKHLDRGIVIGETTYGKGSVQMLFDVGLPVKVSPDKSGDEKLGLKLTTAQYLTAGDISIQGVGVSPDVDLVSLYVRKYGDESWIRLQRSDRRRSESDNEWSLGNPTATKASRPTETVSYLVTPPPGSENKNPLAEEEDNDALDGNEAVEAEEEPEQFDKLNLDFQIEFARDLLAQSKTGRRRELLAAAKGYFESVRGGQDAQVAQALEKLGVDWGKTPAPARGKLEFSLAPLAGEARVKAGEVFKLRGTMRNTGSTPVFRAHAVLQSENDLWNENEMVFGKIAPGETKTYDLMVRVPKATLTRSDAIRAKVLAQGEVDAQVGELVLETEGKARPLFAYTYQNLDDLEGGNRDGRVQPGEPLRLLVRVKNIGAGPALRPRATIRNGGGQDGILISKGRFDRGELAPGEEWPVSFTYQVGKEFAGTSYLLELTVGDRILGEPVTDRITTAIAPGGRAPDPATGAATVARGGAAVYEAGIEGALVIGKAQKGTVWKVTGHQGPFTRVEIEPQHQAFVATADLQQTGGTAPTPTGGATPIPGFDTTWQVMPPVLSVTAPSLVSGETVHLKGSASDDKAVRDLFVNVWNRESRLPLKKVFYRRNTGDPRKVSFELDVPLWPGSNLIQIHARETNDVQSVQTLIVRRAAPRLVQDATKTGL